MRLLRHLHTAALQQHEPPQALSACCASLWWRSAAQTVSAKAGISTPASHASKDD